MRKEPAAFNFSGDFPLEANSLSAYKNNIYNSVIPELPTTIPRFESQVPHATCILDDKISQLFKLLIVANRWMLY